MSYEDYFRKPKTQRELKLNFEIEVYKKDFKIKGRVRKKLPNSFSDIYRSNALSKSWKNSRKKQYK